MVQVGIVGGTGYTGVELLRILAGHPQVRLASITSRAEADTAVADVFANLRGHVDLAFSHPNKANLEACDVVFFATPNGTAMQSVSRLLEAGVRVVDLSADFRLKDAGVWRHWYGMEHACPDLLEEAVYGLPELNRERVAKARVVANPGCYPTAVILGFLPLLEQDVVDGAHLIADAKSGVSGAGRKAATGNLFSEASDNFKAYGVAGHRHLPEIVQALAAAADGAVGLTFVPHLTPMVRGIHATLYARTKGEPGDLRELYLQRYAAEPFVDVMPDASHPDTRSVRGANTCRIAVHRPQGQDTVVVLSVIDNLVKGAAGGAMQWMNRLWSLPESTGLEAAAPLWT